MQYQPLNPSTTFSYVQALSRVTRPILAQFSIPQNYPLLLSIVRSHFVDGTYDASKLATAKDLQSVEGHRLQISHGQIDCGHYNATIAPNGVKADNGIIYHLDRLLDPYASVFGISTTSPAVKTTQIDATPLQEDKTMTDLVLAEPRLSQWTALMKEVLAAILKRLGDRRGPEGVDCRTPHPFAALPANEAFEQLPANYTRLLRAPFNFALSSHLLAWSISVPTCASFRDIMHAIEREGAFRVYSHRADVNLTIRETVKGSGELMINNARVLMANRCAGNGCIWIVDRFVDPVFAVF
jgi:uncharacterized surface protein with fasciclin (FAS1) repeats